MIDTLNTTSKRRSELLLQRCSVEICDFDEVTNSDHVIIQLATLILYHAESRTLTTAILNLTSVTICQICPAVTQLGGT